MALEYLQLYEQLGVSFTKQNGSEAQAKCPFHGDETPSLSVNLESGLFKCFAAQCGKGGPFPRFMQYLEEVHLNLTIDPGIVEAAHQKLLADPTALSWCYKERGLFHETITKYKLGMEAGRLWIPIMENGRYVNVRRHSMVGKVKHGKTLSYKVGYGLVRLWPQESLTAKDIWWCEGELDCLVLLQQGLIAITSTGGADAWKDEWLVHLTAKKIKLVYDTDQAGLDGSRKVAGKLLPLAKEVKLVILPLKPPLKDITDFFVKEGKGREELIAVEEAAKPLTDPDKVQKDTTVYEVDLSQASHQEMVGKNVKLKVVVAGKDLAPFAAPKDVRFTCEMGLRICGGCSIARANGVMDKTVKAEDTSFLKMINCTDELQKVHIRKLVGIVPTCPRFNMEVRSYHNIEELKLLPDLEYMPEVDTEYVIRQGYYMGDGVKTNQAYVVEGVVGPHPSNQYVTFLFNKMQPAQSSIQAYVPTTESIDRLKVFQARDRTMIMERLKDIAADLSTNVTRIYHREDLIHAFDLVFHSPLSFKFQDQQVPRGWVEGLIIGDTRCGKSETAKMLVRHYRMGEIITGENVSYAGLVGGLQQTQKRWHITWGKIPLNDRRALVIDEVSGMLIDDIGKLSGIRSSGIAEITKIQTERALARTRLLWVSNPRANRPLNSYDSGAQVIKELIGRPEDIARFDFCMMVSSNEVPIEQIHKPAYGNLRHVFTSELCHELLLWVWSRKVDQIILGPETIEACLDHASQFSKIYSSELPLVVPNEQRIKFARMAAAIAGRLFSTEDGVNMIVLPEHVELAAKLLQVWYNNTNFNYRFYSEMKLKELDMSADDALAIKNILYPYGLRFCQALLGHQYIRLSDFEDLTGKDRKEARLILGVLVQCGALRRKAFGYTKSPSFIKMLRETTPAHIVKPPEI